MNHFTKILCSTLAVFAFSTAYSAQVEFNCPQDIKTTEKLETLPAGFESMVMDARHYWENVTFYSGKPEDNASLAPDSSKNDRWTFSKEDNIYIGCTYNKSKITLFKMLPKNLVSCVLTRDKYVQGLSGMGVPEKIICTVE